MIYSSPSPDELLDQGDLIEDCPLLVMKSFDLNNFPASQLGTVLTRVLLLTHACDFANRKVTHAVAAVVHDAQWISDQQILKPAEIRGQVRSGRVWGWYFLPKNSDLGLPEMIVHLRALHTIRVDLLTELCRQGKRRARLLTPYREHLAKHFADTYSRIGLPEPYATD